MDVNEFRKEYFDKCIENGLYSKLTRNLMKSGPLVALGCVLSIMLVLVKYQEYFKLAMILGLAILLVYFILLLWRLYVETKDVRKKAFKGQDKYNICKQDKALDKEVKILRELQFRELLGKCDINHYNYKQIDLMIEAIESSPKKKKYNGY